MASSRYQHQSRGNRPSASLYHCQHCLHQPRLPPSTDRCPFSFWSYLSSPPVHQHRQPWQYSTLGPQEAILVQRTLTCHVLWWPYGVGLLCKTLDICVKTKEKKEERGLSEWKKEASKCAASCAVLIKCKTDMFSQEAWSYTKPWRAKLSDRFHPYSVLYFNWPMQAMYVYWFWPLNTLCNFPFFA